MTLYEIIFNWFDSLLNGSNLDSLEFSIGGLTMDMSTWLSHTATIFVLVAICLLLFGFARYLFKAGADLLKW